MKILIVEDDDRVSEVLEKILRGEGYGTHRVAEGEAALTALNAEVEAILLDLGLPDMDGIQLCRRIRERSGVPIIIVTARGQIEERIKGLQAGADDFLVKPYDIRELLARIEAITRRARAMPSEVGYRHSRDIGNVHIDFANRLISVGDATVDLTPKEFDIVAVLGRYPGVVVPSDRIIREVWGAEWHGFKRSLEVHVGSIRRKIDRNGFITTVRGVGYQLMSDE